MPHQKSLHLFNIILDEFDKYLIEFNRLTKKTTRLFEQALWYEQRENNRLRNRLLSHSIHRLSLRVLEVNQHEEHFMQVHDRIKSWDHHYSNNLFHSYYNALQRHLGNTFRPEEIKCNYGLEQNSSTSLYIKLNNIGTGISQNIVESIDLRLKVLEKSKLQAFLESKFSSYEDIKSIQFWPKLFYRNQHAYLIGYVQTDSKEEAFAISFINTDAHIQADSFLKGEAAIIRIVEFTRSYLFVETESPESLIKFLKVVLPTKDTAQLIINLGWQEWGKSLQKQEINVFFSEKDSLKKAPGIEGMVMHVFTSEKLPFVFKVIKEHISPIKDTNRKAVLERYRFVSEHDRVGRLADAQLFEYWEIDKKFFSQELIETFTLDSNQSVIIDNDRIIFKEIFTERKIIPLNIYLENADKEKAEKAIIDYGKAIKELAMSNLFPGDLLLKNFGMSSENKLVFYDYDETVLVTECNFRKLPEYRDEDERMSSESWIVAYKTDIFPEEFEKFLIPEGPLRILFKELHGEIYTENFWNKWKDFHNSGKIIDLQPY